MEGPAPFISRVRLKNYRSIADCDVRLGRLTVLVGPNGSGKSNFLQALALLTRAVNTTPYEAITTFGGLDEILRRAPEPAESLSIDVEGSVPLSPGSDQLGSARYGFEIGIALSPRATFLRGAARVMRAGLQRAQLELWRGARCCTYGVACWIRT